MISAFFAKAKAAAGPPLSAGKKAQLKRNIVVKTGSGCRSRIPSAGRRTGKDVTAGNSAGSVSAAVKHDQIAAEVLQNDFRRISFLTVGIFPFAGLQLTFDKNF